MKEKNNPYDQEFGVPSFDELRLLLNHFRVPLSIARGHVYCRTHITMADIARECRINCKTSLYKIMENRPLTSKQHVSDKKKIKLKRFLNQCLCGMITKENSVVVYHDEPTKPMPVKRKIILGLDGPRMTPGIQEKAPEKMPKFMSLFQVKPNLELLRKIK